jgi:hypothetical protein
MPAAVQAADYRGLAPPEASSASAWPRVRQCQCTRPARPRPARANSLGAHVGGIGIMVGACGPAACEPAIPSQSSYRVSAATSSARTSTSPPATNFVLSV